MRGWPGFDVRSYPSKNNYDAPDELTSSLVPASENTSFYEIFFFVFSHFSFFFFQFLVGACLPMFY